MEDEIRALRDEVAALRREIEALRGERVVHHYYHQAPAPQQPAYTPALPQPYAPVYPAYPYGPWPVTCAGGSIPNDVTMIGYNAAGGGL